MLAWAVAVSLVFVLLLIWSALIRCSMAKDFPAAEKHGPAGRLATEPSLGRGAECRVPDRATPSSGIPRRAGSEPVPWATAAIPQSEAGGAEFAAKHAAGK